MTSTERMRALADRITTLAVEGYVHYELGGDPNPAPWRKALDLLGECSLRYGLCLAVGMNLTLASMTGAAGAFAAFLDEHTSRTQVRHAPSAN